MDRVLDVGRTVRALFEVASGLVVDDPARVFAPGVDAGGRSARRLPVEMTAELGGGTTVAQTVIVELGRPAVLPTRVTCPLTWRPTDHTNLLPVFRGSLFMTPEGLDTGLWLRGTYQPPLGRVGRFGDGLVGHRIARRTVATFLDTVARRIEAEADHHRTVTR
jgi:hypothetical protein